MGVGPADQGSASCTISLTRYGCQSRRGLALVIPRSRSYHSTEARCWLVGDPQELCLTRKAWEARRSRCCELQRIYSARGPTRPPGPLISFRWEISRLLYVQKRRNTVKMYKINNVYAICGFAAIGKLPAGMSAPPVVSDRLSLCRRWSLRLRHLVDERSARHRGVPEVLRPPGVLPAGRNHLCDAGGFALRRPNLVLHRRQVFP